MNPRISRRTVLRLGGLIAGAIAIEAGKDVFDLVEAPNIDYQKSTLAMLGLEEDVYIAHFTDPHIGGRETDSDFVNEDTCAEVVLNINQTLREMGARSNNTIFAFTGDGANGGVGVDEETPLEMFYQGMREFQAVDADWKIMVPGNHDVKHDKSLLLREIYMELGFTVLGWLPEDKTILNTNELPLRIIGTPDYTTQRDWYENVSTSGFVRAFQGKPNLWLTHNATPFDVLGWGQEVAKSGSETLALCGHTHGGQAGTNTPLQYLAHNYALSRIGYESKLVSGLYTVANGFYVDVCNGIGSSSAAVRTASRVVKITKLTPLRA